MQLKGRLTIVSFCLIVVAMISLVLMLNNNSSANRNDLNVTSTEKVVGSNYFEGVRIAPESLSDVTRNADIIIVADVITNAVTVEKPIFKNDDSPLEKKYLEKFKSQKQRTFKAL
jgi:uncharacterized iron-regulated protein